MKFDFFIYSITLASKNHTSSILIQ